MLDGDYKKSRHVQRANHFWDMTRARYHVIRH